MPNERESYAQRDEFLDEESLDVPDEQALHDAARALRVPMLEAARKLAESDEMKPKPRAALREIAEQNVKPKDLKEAVVQSLQRVIEEEDDDIDEIGSLSQSAEALRISASQPARPTSIGSDYDG